MHIERNAFVILTGTNFKMGWIEPGHFFWAGFNLYPGALYPTVLCPGALYPTVPVLPILATPSFILSLCIVDEIGQ